jgi:hypothetical protein
VTEIRLQRSRVGPPVGQRVAAGVPEHMRVSLERQFGNLAGSLNHGRIEGRSEQPLCGQSDCIRYVTMLWPPVWH